MKKILVMGLLVIISVTGMFFIFGDNIDKSSNSGNDNNTIARPYFLTSMIDRDRNLPTIILFKIPSCDACNDMRVLFKNLQEEYNDRFNIVYYDAYEFTNNEVQNAIEIYEIEGGTTSIILDKDGNVVSKIEGLASKEKVLGDLEKAGMKK